MRYPRRGPDMKKRIVCRLVVQNDLVDTEDLAEFNDPISVVIYAGKFVNQQLATGIKAVGIQCPIGRGSVLMTCEPSRLGVTYLQVSARRALQIERFFRKLALEILEEAAL